MLRQADDADPTQPAPGTARLEDLIAGARRAGLETTFTVTGDPVPLPAAVDLAAYRIIQESLTNTIRHAGPATAAVSLGYARDELRIDVTDTGRASPSSRGTAAATGSPGCGSAPPPSAVPSRPVPARPAASGSRPGCPSPRRRPATPEPTRLTRDSRCPAAAQEGTRP